MLVLDAEQMGRELINAHYDAHIVELFGVRASGLSRERVEELVNRELLEVSALEGLDFSDDDEEEPLNPLLFIRRLSSYYFAQPDERQKMRRWDLSRWRAQLMSEAGQAIKPQVSSVSFPTFPRATPEELAPPPHAQSIPSYFGSSERAGLVSAYRTAGGYIRGLGARLADDFSFDVFEVWRGEELIRSPDPAQRESSLKVIREELGVAVLTKPTAQEVARRMRQRIGDLARNFERIAETEIQAVHNEGMIYQAIELDGDAALVARVPESGACAACRRLFIDPFTGAPKIFKVAELIANGVNVGRARRDWLPTAAPVHPQCRCDIIPLDKDQSITSTGRIIKKS